MPIDFDKVPVYIRNEIEYPGKVVKRGGRGMTVRRVQEWLHYHGFRTAIDGDYGPATEKCVTDYQNDRNLSVTGRVNKSLWDDLVKPMASALVAAQDIAGMSDAQAVRSTALLHLDQHPVEIGGANRGPWVRLYCKGNDGPEWAWCAGFVTMVVQQAYFYRGLKAPLKGSVSCDVLASQAKQAGRFVKGSTVAGNQFDWDGFQGCCIFLRRRTTGDWTHTGFGLDLENQAFSTVEGNTNDEGSREGFEACMRTRSITGSYDYIVLSRPG